MPLLPENNPFVPNPKLGGVIGVRLIVTIGIIELIFQVEMELIHHMKNMHARYAMLRCLLPIKLHHG